MTKVPITLATYGYDHVGDLLSGAVGVEGVALTGLAMQFEELLYRMHYFQEFDVSEYSLGKFTNRVAQGDDSLVGLPVFPSRVPRLSAIYVAQDGPVEKPEDLAGRRVGVPEWAQTATIYMRGWLAEHVGVPLAEVDWVQAGVNQAGREDDAEVTLPPDVGLTRVADRSLSEMLLAGDLDAVFSARPPDHFRLGKPGIRRLFPDYQAAEEAYCRKTGVIPIMHTFVIRKDVAQRHPWLARNLLSAFEAAKQNGLARAFDLTASRSPVLWGAYHAERTADIFGPENWPYGVEANRVTLEAFLRYSFEQGITSRHLAPEDLYPENLRSEFKV